MVRLTDRLDMTLDVYHGRKTATTTKKKKHYDNQSGPNCNDPQRFNHAFDYEIHNIHRWDFEATMFKINCTKITLGHFFFFKQKNAVFERVRVGKITLRN